LIEIKGKSDAPGKPLLYTTSNSFMDYFGIKSVKDLPQLKDLHTDQNEIGQPSDLTDTEETFITETTIESQTETISEVTNEEEIIAMEDGVELSDLPDRKAIFMENEEKIQKNEGEVSADSDETSYDSHRD